MNKINVCHFVSGLKAGGVESMIFNYCSCIDKNKYNFMIVYQHDPSQKNVKEFEKLGFKLYRVPSKAKHPLKNYLLSKKILKDNKVDVVHCHMTLMNFIPLFAAKKLNINQRICHSHNSDVRRKNFLIRYTESILKKLCNSLSTCNIACGEDAGKYLFGDNKYTILKNALYLTEFEYKENLRIKIRKKYNISNNTLVIGNVARFTNQKNHGFIISLAEKLVEDNIDFKIVLVGDGELKKEIIKVVNEKNLNNRIIFTGVVKNVNEYYSAFDLFILPSLWEGMPVVGIEAQTSGLKCLFSKNVDKKINICTENVKMLELETYIWIKSIEEIYMIKDYARKNMTEKLRNAGFDITKEVEKLEEIYNATN